MPHPMPRILSPAVRGKLRGVHGGGHRERLWPSPWIWVCALGLAGSFGLVVAPFSAPGAVATTLVAAILIGALLVVSTPTVAAADGELVAGRARIPLGLVGAAVPLAAAQMRSARGPELDARAYLCLRGWISGGVRVELSDPADPTPYWLVSSRDPAGLAAAITAGAGRES